MTDSQKRYVAKAKMYRSYAHEQRRKGNMRNFKGWMTLAQECMYWARFDGTIK